MAETKGWVNIGQKVHDMTLKLNRGEDYLGHNAIWWAEKLKSVFAPSLIAECTGIGAEGYATKIQSLVRGYLVRKNPPPEEAAAMKIQSLVRGYLVRKRAPQAEIITVKKVYTQSDIDTLTANLKKLNDDIDAREAQAAEWRKQNGFGSVPRKDIVVVFQAISLDALEEKYGRLTVSAAMKEHKIHYEKDTAVTLRVNSKAIKFGTFIQTVAHGAESERMTCLTPEGTLDVHADKEGRIFDKARRWRCDQPDSQRSQQSDSATKIQSLFRGYVKRKRYMKMVAHHERRLLMLLYPDESAAKLAKRWLKRLYRRGFLALPKEDAAVRIQCLVRGYLVRKRARKEAAKKAKIDSTVTLVAEFESKLRKIFCAGAIVSRQDKKDPEESRFAKILQRRSNIILFIWLENMEEEEWEKHFDTYEEKFKGEAGRLIEDDSRFHWEYLDSTAIVVSLSDSSVSKAPPAPLTNKRKRTEDAIRVGDHGMLNVHLSPAEKKRGVGYLGLHPESVYEVKEVLSASEIIVQCIGQSVSYTIPSKYFNPYVS